MSKSDLSVAFLNNDAVVNMFGYGCQWCTSTGYGLGIPYAVRTYFYIAYVPPVVFWLVEIDDTMRYMMICLDSFFFLKKLSPS